MRPLLSTEKYCGDGPDSSRGRVWMVIFTVLYISETYLSILQKLWDNTARPGPVHIPYITAHWSVKGGSRIKWLAHWISNLEVYVRLSGWYRPPSVAGVLDHTSPLIALQYTPVMLSSSVVCNFLFLCSFFLSVFDSLSLSGFVWLYICPPVLLSLSLTPPPPL